MQTDSENEFRAADWQIEGVRLLVFARYWAKAHYGWHEGKLLPSGKSPEDVVCEVYASYARGQRKFNSKDSMRVQLRSAVKSMLWNLHQLREHKLTQATDPEVFEPIEGRIPAPDVAIRSEEFCRRFFELLHEDSRVKRHPELKRLIEALEEGALDVSEFIKKTGLAAARVYELRRNLKGVAEQALKRMNREDYCYEKAISKRGATTA